MQLGWIDFSKEDRQKALDVINLLSEQGAVDELGIGIIRDAFANYFFPGTSTIQTRAKYFLIVPYVLREAVDGRYGKDVNRVLRAIDSAEKDCGIRLLEADPKAEGVIGTRVLPNGWVARKPSDIYWNGIRTFGIFCDYGLSIPEYVSLAVKLKEQKSVSRLGNRNDDAEENDKDDSDAGDIGNIRFWNLPIYHDDWRDNLTIELTQEEAFYLDKQIQKSTKGSLLEYVLKNHIDLNEYDDFASLTAELSEKVSEKLAYMMKLACDFNNLVYMAISVSMLEPDLVIMDEFQRFKFLLSSDDSELGILAHSFLSGHDTRVLLLSATPYKLYSTLEEIDENQLDEHYAEFFQVMNFLFDDEVKDIKFKEVWKNYSHALSELKAGDSAIIRMKELAENAMYQGVSRTERISVMDSGDYTDDSSVKHHLQIDENDINSYIQMSRLLSKTDSNHSLPVDYAKSCPYLMSFMKKYKIKEQIEKYYIKHPDEFGSEREQSLLWLNRNKINKYDELPKTNARLEALKEKAFTGGAEKYLWIPPSLPYYEMQGAYKNSKGFSKILVFSAWEMVPRMIGALVSYEAERLTVGKLVHQIKNQDKKNTGYFAEGSRRYPVARLRFNVSNGEVRGMSLFALLYPSKTLSDMYLPIESLNNHESLEVIEKSVRLKLKEKLAIIEEKYGDSGNNKEDARWYYLAPMLMDGVIYAKHWIEDIVWEMNTDEEDTTFEVRSSSKDKRNKGFIAHIDKLRSYLDAPEEIHLGRKPEDLLETLVNMVLGSPAICIYRSNGRSTARATSLAKVFVNNFNLPESTAIIDLAYGRCRDDNSHWQNVLKYCKDGCFQAMIDEYIHMLKETAGFQSDGNQYQIVHDMMMDSLKIHTATYIADTYPDFKKRINGADRKSDGCRIRSSYAVGFTKDAGDNSKVVMRKENIRNAFNSPMRPFVLATTSIGQEGLDFHNYCRVIMHWNLPSNPIDVGRILRTFKIKKNVEVTDNGKIII